MIDLNNISTATKFQMFNNLQEEVLHGLKGDVYAICAAYRYMTRKMICTGKTPAYAELPHRLTMGVGRPGIRRKGNIIDGRAYATMVRRFMAEIPTAKESLLKLEPPSQISFTDNALERARRVLIYTKQVEELDRQAGALEETKGSPISKPVYCEDLNRWFESGCEAAEVLTGIIGKLVRRKDIRTSIVNGGRCARYKFSYDGPTEGKPQPKIMVSDKGRKVKCVEIAEPFANIEEACKHAGVTVKELKAVLNGDGLLNGQHWLYYKRKAVKINKAEKEVHIIPMLFDLKPVKFTPRPRKVHKFQSKSSFGTLFQAFDKSDIEALDDFVDDRKMNGKRGKDSQGSEVSGKHDRITKRSERFRESCVFDLLDVA